MAQRADILLVFFLGTVLSGQRGNKLQLKLRFDIDTDSNLHFATFIKHRNLRESLPKTGPLRFASENQFPLNFAHEYILVQK